MGILGAHLILYVADQRRSAEFYARVLDISPRLDVVGMTEFELSSGSILGLMPEASVRKLLGAVLGAPTSHREARAELYLLVEDPEAYHARAIEAGARELSAVRERGWGHRAGYSLDPDTHVLAFASDHSGDPRTA